MNMQPTLPLDQPAPNIHEVLASLRRLRILAVDVEYTLQETIARQFTRDGIAFAKEFQLGTRNRIDFLLPGGIGVEVKKGKPYAEEVMAQVDRYCRFDQVTRLVLVVERNVFRYEKSANGKPVHYIALNKLWGIAL